jgi:rhomboid protease GluP
MAEPLKPITPDMLADDPFRPARVDFEKGLSAAPAFAIGLIILNLLVFALEIRLSLLSSFKEVIYAGAVYGEKVFAGQSWRLVTGMFMHASLGHLFGNCLALYLVGMAAEQAWGRWRSLGIYFASGLAASFASALMETRPSIGASGAVFGVMGAVMVFFFRHGNSFYARNRRVGNFLIAWALLQLWLGTFNKHVDNWAHLGGMLAGAAIGALSPSRFFRSRGAS